MDWKVLAVILVIVAIIVTGLLSSSNALKGIKDSFTSLFSGVSKPNAKGNISLTATILADITTLSLGDAELISINSTRPDVQIMIGKEKLDLSNVNNAFIQIENFTGKETIYLNNKTMSLEGNAEKVLVSPIGIIPVEKTASISITGLKADAIVISNLTIKQLSTGAIGQISVNNDKVSTRLDGDKITIDNYFGNLNVNNALGLSGKAERISIIGNINIEIK